MRPNSNGAWIHCLYRYIRACSSPPRHRWPLRWQIPSNHGCLSQLSGITHSKVQPVTAQKGSFPPILKKACPGVRLLYSLQPPQSHWKTRISKTTARRKEILTERNKEFSKFPFEYQQSRTIYIYMYYLWRKIQNIKYIKYKE